MFDYCFLCNDDLLFIWILRLTYIDGGDGGPGSGGGGAGSDIKTFASAEELKTMIAVSILRSE